MLDAERTNDGHGEGLAPPVDSADSADQADPGQSGPATDEPTAASPAEPAPDAQPAAEPPADQAREPASHEAAEPASDATPEPEPSADQPPEPASDEADLAAPDLAAAPAPEPTADQPPEPASDEADLAAPDLAAAPAPEPTADQPASDEADEAAQAAPDEATQAAPDGAAQPVAADPAAQPGTDRAGATPAATPGPAPEEGPEPAPRRRRAASRPAGPPPAAPLFVAPAEPAPPARSRRRRAAEPPADAPAVATEPTEPTEPDQPAPAPEPVETSTAVLFQPPVAVPVEAAPGLGPVEPEAGADEDEAAMPELPATGADTAPVEGDADDSAEDDTASDEDGDESDEDEVGEDGTGPARRRRRRRGGRGRRRPAADDGEPTGADGADGTTGDDGAAGTAGDAAARRTAGTSQADGADAAQPASPDPAAEPAAQDGGPAPAGTQEQPADATSSASRRRRRRRRRADTGETGDAGGTGDAGRTGSTSDDPPNTVVRVRAPRTGARSDEITGIRGSTRIEAKKQRRRDGRDANRRRPPILSEAEFLARRESVDRALVVRQAGDLTQIAVLEDGVLVEHYVSRHSQQSLIGSVYLGRVQNVLPAMEAAFVDIGRQRNAVLYAGEVDWAGLGVPTGQPKRIESALSPGQSVLVQVTKDPVGHKGARLTSQISLPGRYLVYVPAGTTAGISRKLSDAERTRLKRVLKDVVPDDAGVIVRTAAEGASEEELTRDVTRLRAQWDDIQRRAKGNGPTLLYGEPDLAIKVVRDLFNEDFGRLIVSGDEAWATIESYVAQVAPNLQERLQRWSEPGDVFAAHRIDEQMAKALDRKVHLPSGGSLVIDRTEAMTVVDVNTGRFVGSGGNLEQTVTQNNLEAAEEVVRQLRLRDIGGIIVIDFIDMVLESNRDLVMRRLVECLGRDRTKHQVAEVTSLGLVQMTRKRIGTGLLEAFSEPCAACHGRGVIVAHDPVGQTAPAGDAPPAARRRRGRAKTDAASTGPSADAPAAPPPHQPIPAGLLAASGLLPVVGADGVVEDVPSEDVPGEDVPDEDVPDEDVPDEDIPSEDIPSEETPGEARAVVDVEPVGAELPA